MAKKKNQTVVNTKNDLKERDKAIKTMLTNIEKNFGAGAIMKLNDKSNLNIERISTGSLGLDYALGGGIPRGRITEIYGAESSGKTTIALHVIAEAQKNGGIVAYIDAEHALDPVYAKALGVDVDEVLISQPDFGEQALDIADMLARSGAVDVIVVDSVAALVPQAEIEGLMSEQQMGLQARLMSKGLRKLTGNLKKTDTSIIFINQLREKIGGMPSFNGPQTTTTGGRALKFFASVRIEVRRVGSVKSGDDIIGNETVVKITKNKVAPPFKEASFEIMYGKGISKIGEYMTIAENINLISKSGSWYKYGDVRLQGREKLRDRFELEPELFEELKSKIDELIKENKIVLGKKSKLKDNDEEDESSDSVVEDGEAIETEADFEE